MIIKLNHFVVHLKLTQRCKSAVAVVVGLLSPVSLF